MTIWLMEGLVNFHYSDMRAKAIGWVRDCKGNVVHHTYKDISNCLTTMCGGGHTDPRIGMGNTTPYVLIYKEM